MDPQLIIWENYNIRIYERTFRTIFFWFFAFIFLVGVFSTVTALEKRNYDIAALTPKVKCPKKVTEEKALKDYAIEDLSQRDGSYHCFCKNKLAAVGSIKTMNYEFEQDDDKRNLCKNWVIQTNLYAMQAMMIPGMIGVINVGVEIIIGFGSEFISRPRNYQMVVLETMTGVCGIQIINLSLLFVLISIDLKTWLNVFGVLQGNYKEINAAWYIEYGTMIV